MSTIGLMSSIVKFTTQTNNIAETPPDKKKHRGANSQTIQITIPGRGLAVNFRKKCGGKKLIFTAYFLHLFAVNAVNRGELFIFTALSVFSGKRTVSTGFRTSDLLHAFNCLVHCANCHLLPLNFL